MQRRWAIAALLATLAGHAGAQQAAPASAPADTSPAIVVQRFVDAANARDAAAMAALVAPDAVFACFPDRTVFAESRDSVHALYSRLLSRVSPVFRVTVQPRIVEGSLVIDQEHFSGTPGEEGRATWMYLVRDGLIHRAWALAGDPQRRPAHCPQSTKGPGP